MGECIKEVYLRCDYSDCGNRWVYKMMAQPLKQKHAGDRHCTVYIASKRMHCPACNRSDRVFVEKVEDYVRPTDRKEEAPIDTMPTDVTVEELGIEVTLTEEPEPTEVTATSELEPKSIIREEEIPEFKIVLEVESDLEEPIEEEPIMSENIPVQHWTEEQYRDDLIAVKGIGRKTAKKIMARYPTRDALKDAVRNDRNALIDLLRDDVVDKLVERMGD